MLLLILLVMPAAHATGTFSLLKPGEALTYRVGWGLLSHAGEIKISAESASADGASHILVNTRTSTSGVVRTFYTFDGNAQSCFDAQNGRLLRASATTASKKRNTQASIAFDYTRGEAGYVDHLRPERSASLPLPKTGLPMDFITALIQSRVWGLVPGQSSEALVLFDKEFYPLSITAEREETISTPAGPRKAVLLVPRMQGKPRGMFRKGGSISVWVSADDDRLPLRFEVKLNVGTAYAVLTDYQAPVAN